MTLLPIHGQAACALVFAATLVAAPQVVTPHESGPVCALVGAAEAAPGPGFAELGAAPPPACIRVALP
ncbi:MAG: hypothetical protein ACREBO_01245 [Novosphingobium sp.]